MLFCFFGAKDARKGNRVVGQWEQQMLPCGGVESTEVTHTGAGNGGWIFTDPILG